MKNPIATPDPGYMEPGIAEAETVEQRDLYFKIEIASDTDDDAGTITYGFTNEPVPAGYRSIAVPGTYVWLINGALRGVYIRRRFARITKIGLDGQPTGLNPGGPRVL